MNIMSWIELLTKILNNLSDFFTSKDGIIAVATVVLVGVTIYYAYTTNKILQTYDKPEVIIYLFPSESFYIFPGETETNCINLSIENIGTGLASDVKFSGDLSFILPITRIPSPLRKAGEAPQRPKGVRLGEISVFKNGINYFPPGRKIEIPFFFATQREDLLEESLNLAVTYKSSKGKFPRKCFNLEFDQWEDYTQPLAANVAIAGSLKKIQNNITEFLRGIERRS